jgi:LysR family glycine cleavage system transcriptional activator
VRRKLVISTFASLAARWVMPRVQSFATLFPEVDLQVQTSTRLVDFSREDVDIALRFGTGRYPGLHVVPLFAPKDIVVCAPALLRGGPAVKEIADLQHHTLLHDDSYRNWTLWLEAAGEKSVNPRRGIICGDRNSMLQAALEGQGIGLIPEIFAINDLSSGRLLKIFERSLKTEYSIFAVCLPQRLTDPVIAAAIDWLTREAAASSAERYPPAG